MIKLEYLDKNYKLHVIDGENGCVPEGWVLVPEGADKLTLASDGEKHFWVNGVQFLTDGEITPNGKEGLDFDKWSKEWNPEILWSRKMKEYLVERNGKYELVEAYHLDGGIEVPEGAEVYFKFRDSNRFLTFKENLAFSFTGFGYMLHDLTKIGIMENKDRILWQRKPQLDDQCEEIEEMPQDSNVRNPKHYTSHPSGIECIEITRHHDFAIGNAIKYLWRAGLKDSDNEIQDLEKAVWYIQDKIKQLRGGK